MVITITGTQDREAVSYRAREKKLLVIFIIEIQERHTLVAFLVLYSYWFSQVYNLREWWRQIYNGIECPQDPSFLLLSSLCASVIIHQLWKSFSLWRRWGLGLPGRHIHYLSPLVAAQGQTNHHTPAWFIGAFKASSSAARLIYTVLSWQLSTLGNTAAYCKLATQDNDFYHSMNYSLQSL